MSKPISVDERENIANTTTNNDDAITLKVEVQEHSLDDET